MTIIPGKVQSIRGLAEAIGRAGAKTQNEEQLRGVALALQYIVGELSMQSWDFDSEAFRAEADKQHDAWTEQHRKERESNAALSKMLSNVLKAQAAQSTTGEVSA